MFVTFEGVDGSGKTTQARLLHETLQARGRDAVATREPGGTQLGERIRALLLDGAGMSPWAEAALFAAARAELAAGVIRPAVERGADVVCDRYLDSSLVYQGVARGLGIEAVLQLNLLAIGNLLPDRTFVLVCNPAVAQARLSGERDRLEREDEGFRDALRDGYERLASLFPERVRALDGTLPEAELARLVLAELDV
jgi:dTMP kinase